MEVFVPGLRYLGLFRAAMDSYGLRPRAEASKNSWKSRRAL